MTLLPDVAHAPLAVARDIVVALVFTVTALELMRIERRRERATGGCQAPSPARVPRGRLGRMAARVALRTGLVATPLCLLLIPVLLITVHIYVPKLGAGMTPAQKGLPMVDASFIPSDGFTLRGWYVPASGSSRTVILAQGLGARREMLLPYHTILHTGGYNVLSFDFRASGHSDGYRAGYGVNEWRDVRAAVDWVRATHAEGSRWIAAMGLSYATGVLLCSAGRFPEVSAYVLDSPLADAAPMLTWRMRMLGMPRLLEPFTVSLACLWARVLEGFPIESVRPIEHMGEVGQRPVLIIHGTQDGNIPYQHGQALCAALLGPHECWFPEDVGHVSAVTQRPDEYRSHLLRFLDRASEAMAARNAPRLPSR